jgi:Carboxypeptidase regulatory-like domain
MASVLSQQPARDRVPPPSAGTGSIQGRIVILGSMPVAPVRRARVSLQGGRLTEAQFTDSDTDGRYRFDNLPAGAYRVKAEKPGFVSLEYGARRPFEAPLPLDIKPDQLTTADIALPRGAALEGQIVNADGEPLQNTMVSAVRLAYTPNGRRPMAVQQARTDDLGRYRVHSLPPGDYYIDAAIDPRQALVAPTVPRPRPPGSVRTYYPGTSQVQEAQRITVAVGQEIGRLDFAMTSVSVARITAQVIDASGKSPATASARMQLVGGLASQISAQGDPRAPGTFRFPSVPPGEYWVTAAATSTPGADPEFVATRINVSGQDVDLTLRTEPGARLEGRIEIDSAGAAPPLAGLPILELETEFQLPNPGGPAAANAGGPIVGADGRFTIANLLSPRLLRFNRLPSGWALKGVWLNSTEISDATTDFRGASSPRSLRVVITDRTASVSGTVTDDGRRPVDEYRVVVFAEDEQKLTTRSRFVQSVAAAAGGRYTIDTLLPGKYLICAVDHLEEYSWTDLDVLRRLRSIALPLTLAEGDKQTIVLTRRALP